MPIISILDSKIHYRDAGVGVPFVFIHGNPTSSYVWRNIMPNIGDATRTLAPDLIGMGESGKPAIPYRFADHARYLDAWFDALQLEGAVLVGHDWGGALAMDWAARHPDRIRGIVLMETILRPLGWDDFPPSHRVRYETLRAPATGEAKVLDENFFIEQALKLTVRSGLSPEDHDVYRRPYPTPESRKPLLAWPREMPIEGTPVDTIKRIEAYDEWLAGTPAVPKLLLTFDGDNGTLMIGPRLIDWALQNIAALEIEGCGAGAHVCPEDQPQAIAGAIRSWADRHRLR
jgi:haloalkane dehalogenase